MKILDRYIRNTVLSSWVMVMFVLLGLDAVFSFIDQFDKLKQGYHAREAAIFVIATLPQTMYEFVSVATLLACLIGLGSMAGNSELIIFRTSGISVSRILLSIMKPVGLIVLFGFFLGQYISPNTSEFAESYRSLKLGNVGASNFKDGYWQKEGNTFIYIKGLESNGILHGVRLFEFDENQQLRSSKAYERSIYQGDSWSSLGVRSTFVEEDVIRSSVAANEKWFSKLTPDMLKLLVMTPDKLSITELYQYANYLEAQGQSAEKYYLSFWNKMLLPFSTVAMVLIASFFIFGSLRETTVGSRVIVGIVIGLVFQQAQTLSAHIALVYHFDPALASSIPAAIALACGIILVRRVF